MGVKTLGTIPEEIVDKYSTEAEQLGLNRTQYIRQCIEAGRTVFQSSGQVDIERLREITEDSQVTNTSNDLATADSNITETILKNLPTEEERALSIEEIQEIVFGTEDEQKEQIKRTLQELRQQGAIEALVEDGYIKSND